MTQLGVRSLPIPDVDRSLPVIGKKLTNIFAVNCREGENKEKRRPGMAYSKNVIGVTRVEERLISRENNFEKN